MVIAFLVNDKYGKSGFSDKTFILADMSMDVALEISFFTLNNVEVNFTNYKLN